MLIHGPVLPPHSHISFAILSIAMLILSQLHSFGADLLIQIYTTAPGNYKPRQYW